MSTVSKNRPVVFLFGPTGVGKTGLLSYGYHPWAEIIVADSIQVFKGLDIGSAKPNLKERLEPFHHLLDVRLPDQPFDVGDFVTAADEAVADILSRGKVPVISGGTAFYFYHFLFGLPGAPPAQPEFRAQSLRDGEAWGEAGLRERLAVVDPVSEARIQRHDTYRLTRAWEVWLQTGRPLSGFDRGTQARAGLDVLLLGLDRPRPELHHRLEKRVDELFDRGLEQEVRELVGQGYGPSDPGLRGIGYAEFFPYLAGAVNLSNVRDAILVHSRQYAKRQLTFFRSIPGVQWFHPDEQAQILALIRGWSLTHSAT